VFSASPIVGQPYGLTWHEVVNCCGLDNRIRIVSVRVCVHVCMYRFSGNISSKKRRRPSKWLPAKHCTEVRHVADWCLWLSPEASDSLWERKVRLARRRSCCTQRISAMLSPDVLFYQYVTAFTKYAVSRKTFCVVLNITILQWCVHKNFLLLTGCWYQSCENWAIFSPCEISKHKINAWFVTKRKNDVSRFWYHTKDHLA